MVRALKAFYKKEGRSHLPWRKTADPYKILVSEMMLQQTQVERVLLFYAEFTRRFPTARTLAAAPLSDVLKAWQGLGYNRRAKYLHEAAKVLSFAEISFEKVLGSPVSRSKRSRARPFSQKISASQFKQLKLPGVGPYTRGAVLAFAFNKPEVFVETNIRTVLFHSNILKNARMSDKELLPIVAALLKKSKMQPRDFYAAMMDYGAYLKKQGIRLNNRSTHYAKQSKFEGSTRQKRAAALRVALKRGASEQTLAKLLK